MYGSRMGLVLWPTWAGEEPAQKPLGVSPVLPLASFKGRGFGLGQWHLPVGGEESKGPQKARKPRVAREGPLPGELAECALSRGIQDLTTTQVLSNFSP